MTRRGNGFKDMTGQVVGKLTVLDYAGVDKGRAAVWLCRCECGQEVEVRGTSLRKGDRKSCGCLDRRRGGKPRRSNTPATSAPTSRPSHWVAERQGLLVLLSSMTQDDVLIEFDKKRKAWVCSECGPGECAHVGIATKAMPLEDAFEVAAVVAPRQGKAKSAISAAEGQKANDRALAEALVKTAQKRAREAAQYDEQHQRVTAAVTTRRMTKADRARLEERRATKRKPYAWG